LSKIATAHHLNDNVETFLHRFSRGSSIFGLRGIDRDDGVLIRPLLEIPKKEIGEFLEERGTEYCVDESNFENIYTRNRLRNRVIPLLEKFENRVQEKISKIEQELFDIHCDIEKFLPSPYSERGIEIKILRMFTPYVAKYYIAKAAQKLNISLSRSKLEQIYLSLERDGSIKHDVHSYYIVKEYDIIRFEEKKSEELLEVPYSIGRDILWGKFKISSRIVESALPHKKGYVYLNKKCMENHNIVIRSRREGDIFSPSGMASKKKLKEIFINDKIPMSQRDRIPLICIDREVLAIFPRRISQNAVVMDSDSECVELIIEEEI